MIFPLLLKAKSKLNSLLCDIDSRIYSLKHTWYGRIARCHIWSQNRMVWISQSSFQSFLPHTLHLQKHSKCNLFFIIKISSSIWSKKPWVLVKNDRNRQYGWESYHLVGTWRSIHAIFNLAKRTLVLVKSDPKEKNPTKSKFKKKYLFLLSQMNIELIQDWLQTSQWSCTFSSDMV